MTRRRIAIYLSIIGLLFVLALSWYARAFYLDRLAASVIFDGKRAYADVQTQVAFGPRIPGSDAHAKILAWMRTELESAGWQVEVQQSEAMGHPIQNLVAHRSDVAPQIILGAHYDSRLHANRDPNPANQNRPVPGANDGASGVAVLLELARTLPKEGIPVELVFFDVEDNGEIPGWDWILGSTAFFQNMTTASKLGLQDSFISQVKYNILDDHIPFVQAGIPSVDIIDIDYPYWHTLADTPEHVSADSLKMVGDVLLEWLGEQKPQSN
ncbi:MAG: M28 family peptidase [Chloroflexi bacterium]|nr:M28 family peptidase [Chloroflexota bacterium]